MNCPRRSIDLEPPPDEQRREGLAHHDPQDGRIAGAGGGDGLSGQRSAQHILDMDQIGQLGHGGRHLVWHSSVAPVQTPLMPLWALIAVVIASIGCTPSSPPRSGPCAAASATSLHWEKDEPLEGVGDWD